MAVMNRWSYVTESINDVYCDNKYLNKNNTHIDVVEYNIIKKYMNRLSVRHQIVRKRWTLTSVTHLIKILITLINGRIDEVMLLNQWMMLIVIMFV